jgi:hypothetical protein
MREHTVGMGSVMGFAACPLITILFLGCSSPGSVGGSGNGAGGGGGQGIIVLGNMDATISGVGGSTTNPTPTDDANCGAAISEMRQQPADLLLVLDRSTSMTWDLTRDSEECPATSTTCQQRWATLTRTLDEVITSSSAQIRWGLKFFATPTPSGGPDGDAENCNVTPGVEIEVGAGSASTIRNSIQAAAPVGYTPTLPAIKYATQYLSGLANPYQRYILLATDGEPNCDGGSPTTSAAVQVNHVVSEIKAAVAAGIKVYVIGMGPATNLRNLDKFAVAGDTDHYYPATSAAELSAALFSIVGQVASCTYALATPPPDPNNLAVYLDKQIVPRDASNGWVLGPDQRSILFTGSYCEGIKAQEYKLVQVYFGCPNTEPPAVIP